jgi:hypothetical protein
LRGIRPHGGNPTDRVKKDLPFSLTPSLAIITLLGDSAECSPNVHWGWFSTPIHAKLFAGAAAPVKRAGDINTGSIFACLEHPNFMPSARLTGARMPLPVRATNSRATAQNQHKWCGRSQNTFDFI